MWRFNSVVFLLAGTLCAGIGLGAEPAEEHSELEAQLDQARQEVDRAVGKLADLLKEKMEQVPDGSLTEWFEPESGAELGVMINRRQADGGVLINDVSADSGADQAGLKAGDLLVMIDDTRLDEAGGSKALRDHMRTVEPGQEVAVRVLRDGATKQVTVVAQPRSTRMRGWVDGLDLDIDLDLDDLKLDDIEVMGHRVEAAAAPRLVDLDADLGAYFGTDQGALVVNAPEDGTLKGGDVLLTVGGEAVTTASEARRAFADVEEPLEVEVMRQKDKLSLSIGPDQFPRHIGKRIRIIKVEEGELP